LVTGAAKRLGFQVGLSLAGALPEGSKIYLTTVNKNNIDKLNNHVKALDKEGVDMISFVGLDFTEKKSISEMYGKILEEQNGRLDVLINNSQKYMLPALLDDAAFHKQAVDTMSINYYGLKLMCKMFAPLLKDSGRIVNCTSHLGHLCNIDGQEPQAAVLRKRFADVKEEADLDKLVMEFLELTQKGGGAHYSAGWPSCPYTVSKIAVNSYTMIQQSNFNEYHKHRDLAVNAVHHGAMHRLMNTVRGFTDDQSAELIKNVALLPVDSPVKGKVIWKDMMTFDNWQYGGLEDNDKTKKPFIATFDILKDFDTHQHDMNYGFCLDG